ncbi:branched-chain amino acid ABC transporter permease [Pseudooceanicola sp. 216_PA32_1]|uniref:Branched-chain amino acid ABC transporter permease n=1 Tax=Pseudooceanicola pacificus TaxID=2676438 RepID=A0A844W5M6_9RHOB|nr:branched-chain amino acid ABC transporter permease [Pseudooceanicola pacificus]MWB78121.1 branched-chain amino acid ABC transporter permease [Pseudooceanicola pacificus]
MNYLAELLASGLAVGAVYGLIAMSFAIIYKSTGLLNFAQGEMGMIIAYVAWSISTSVDGNPFIVALGSIGFAVLFALAVERIVIRPMMSEPILSQIMVTIGLSVIFRSAIILIWDGLPHNMAIASGNQLVDLGGVRVRAAQIAVLVALFAAIAGMWAFFRYSRFGVAMRAVASDDATAQLMGVSSGKVQMAAWAAAAVLSGVAGVLFAIAYELSPSLYALGLKAFPATILGGLDAVIGSAVGGLIIGVTENLVGGYISSGLKEVAGFVIIILILMVRPYGLFGEKRIERL